MSNKLVASYTTADSRPCLHINGPLNLEVFYDVFQLVELKEGDEEKCYSPYCFNPREKIALRGGGTRTREGQLIYIVGSKDEFKRLFDEFKRLFDELKRRLEAKKSGFELVLS